jgi:DNA-directed RNA polymerase subunit omega
LTNQEGDAIQERVNNRYSIVVLAAKRAKQLKEGAPALIETTSANFLTVALEEIAAGKVTYTEAPDEPESKTVSSQVSAELYADDNENVSAEDDDDDDDAEAEPGTVFSAELAAFLSEDEISDSADNISNE